MEISKSISFITEDPRWQQKLLIGTGLVIGSSILSVVLIGIVGFIILAGYCVRLFQNVRDGQAYPLPEWDQWGEDLARGFKLFVTMLVWGLPILILVIPSIIGSTMSSSRNEGAQFMGAMLSICGSCLTIIYGLLLAVVSPGITIAFAKDEQITSGLQFRPILQWTQANIGQVLVATLVYIAASIALSLIGSIVGVLLCVIGLIITIPLASLLTTLFQYHLYGQLAHEHPYPSAGTTGMSSDSGTVMIYEPPTESYTEPYTTTTTPTGPEVTQTPPDIAQTPPDTASSAPTKEISDYPDSGVDKPPPPPLV
jgi:hypothetical protein